MVFRDESVASRSRIEALELEVARLTRENEALSGAAVDGRPRIGTRMAIGIPVSIAVALGIGAWYTAFVISGRDAEQVGIALAAAAALSLVAAIGVALLARLMIVVPPNRVAVILGRRGRSPDGTDRGFRIVAGGRAIRVPLLEAFAMLPDGPFSTEVVIGGVCLRRPEGSRADVRLRALVSYHRDEPRLRNAIERYLGVDRDVVTKVARDTLEGALRDVAAVLSAEELQVDREKVAHEIRNAAETTLDELGLRIDALHILEIDPRSA